MDGLAKAGQTHEAKIIFDEMMKKHVKSGKLSFVVSHYFVH
jgi:pentatricopeptide repeat protein